MLGAAEHAVYFPHSVMASAGATNRSGDGESTSAELSVRGTPPPRAGSGMPPR
jgi:hypothetical protein